MVGPHPILDGVIDEEAISPLPWRWRFTFFVMIMFKTVTVMLKVCWLVHKWIWQLDDIVDNCVVPKNWSFQLEAIAIAMIKTTNYVQQASSSSLS